MSTYKKEEYTVPIEVGIYRDQEFEEVADKKKMLCDEKKALHYELSKIDVPVDGKWSTL